MSPIFQSQVLCADGWAPPRPICLCIGEGAQGPGPCAECPLWALGEKADGEGPQEQSPGHSGLRGREFSGTRFDLGSLLFPAAWVGGGKG